MAGPVATKAQTIQKLWSLVNGRKVPPAPEVVIHDPAAQQAHDLDDPFFDAKVRARMAGVIAATGNRKCKNSF